MIKKGALFAILLSAFVIGMALGSAPEPAPSRATLAPTTQLEEAIRLYEEAVNEGRPYVPYSVQVQARSAGIPGTNDNAVARLGQGVGSFLQTLVREFLRALVRFFDGLMSS